VPIGLLGVFRFDLQRGIDSIIPYDSWWSFTDVREEEWWNSTSVRKNEGCEVKPDTVECLWFSVVKRDSVVFASVKQNHTGRERYATLDIKGKGSHEECTGEPGEIAIVQCPEPMELSKEELLFNSEGGIDNVIVTTNRTSWLEYPFIYLRDTAMRVICYISQENFSCYGDPIKYDWLAIDIIDGEKIIFSVSKNKSGKERNAILTLDSWNCGHNVKVIQSAE